MSFIKFGRNVNGRVSMGNLNDHTASQKAAATKKFELASESLRDYKKIIGKKTQPTVSNNDLDAIFTDLKLDVLAKK